MKVERKERFVAIVERVCWSFAERRKEKEKRERNERQTDTVKVQVKDSLASPAGNFPNSYSCRRSAETLWLGFWFHTGSEIEICAWLWLCLVHRLLIDYRIVARDTPAIWKAVHLHKPVATG
jgi:hypothetical protein